MKKIQLYIISFILIASGFIISPAIVSAQGLDDFVRTDKATLDQLNPLRIGQSANPSDLDEGISSDDLDTPAELIGRALMFAFPVAGIILFIMITWGGFEILAGSTRKKSLDDGKNRVTAALIGFVILFISYWLMLIIQEIFGVNIVTFT